MQIKIIYFASLRDAAKKSEETIETAAITVEDLFENLHKKYSFDIQKSHLRVAINEEYQDFTTKINPNDTIVFIPPVAGG